MNNIVKCSNDSFSTFFKVIPKISTIFEKTAQLLVLLSFSTWNFTLPCSILNENKLFRNHDTWMFENTYVNCRKKIRYLLD